MAANIDGTDNKIEWKKREWKEETWELNSIKINIWLKLIASIVSTHLTLNSLVFHFLVYEGKGNNENAMNNAYSYVSLRVRTSTFANL